MAIDGSASIEIDAPIALVYEIAADVEGSPRWQPEIKKAQVLERDGDEQTLVHTEADGKVRTLKTELRFTYDAPMGLSWQQEEGDLKDVQGSWTFEELGEDRTKATYQLHVDLGRALGLVVRGPLVDILRGQLCDSMPAKLKRFVEAQR